VFWKTGVQIVIFLSGLQSIPDSLYEAAKVDNANGWDMLWKVTIPILSPVILLNTIYTIIDSFRDQSNPIVMHIVKTINASQYGPGTAMGWLYFLVSFIIIGFVFLIMRRAVYYEK
jgi:ABC-type sugar transport system permease subunit